MSYTTWHNYGYGICVDDIKTRDVTRLESMLKLAPNLDREIHRWLEECSISEPVWDDYMEFDQDFMLGLATILQKVIEEVAAQTLPTGYGYEYRSYSSWSPSWIICKLTLY